MRGLVIWYRVMAYVTGVILVILCILAILQPVTSDEAAVNVVGTAHGFLYLIYLFAAYFLARRLRLAPWPTVLMLLAGTIPVLTFIVERRVSKRYLAPPPAAARTGAPAGSGGRQ